MVQQQQQKCQQIIFCNVIPRIIYEHHQSAKQNLPSEGGMKLGTTAMPPPSMVFNALSGRTDRAEVLLPAADMQMATTSAGHIPTK